MEIKVFETGEQLAAFAAAEAGARIKRLLADTPEITIVAATGNSQLQFLDNLTGTSGIDWGRVVFFHLDEYVGLSEQHPASFRRYLRERIERRIHPKAFHFIQADREDPKAECDRLAGLIRQRTIHLAFVGVGENGHLAFNDPPADFQTNSPYLVVDLDEACRRQQVNEGWFPGMEAVPRQAISMSVPQIMKAETILCIVPEKRKAKAVLECFGGPVSNMHPASILQQHPQALVLLDKESASLLKG